MTADDRPQTAFARLARRTADLLRPFVGVAAAIGLLIAAIPPVPHWDEYEAEAWAVPPVRATVGSFPQSRWHPGALTVEALGGTVPLERVHDDDRRWEWLPAGLVATRESTRPKDWAPSGAHPIFRSFGRGPLAEEEAAELDAILWRWRFHFQYGLTISLWPFLLSAALWAGWRVLHPRPLAGPPGLLRRLVRPWVWTFALLGAAAIAGPFARAGLPTDTPWWAVNGQIGPATTPHPRLIAIDAGWAIDPPPPPVSVLLRERVENPRLGVWANSSAHPAGVFGGSGIPFRRGNINSGAFSLPPLGTQIGGLGGGGMGGGGVGGGGAATVRWRAGLELRISLWWLLLPAELANLVTLFRARPRRLAPDTPAALA